MLITASVVTFNTPLPELATVIDILRNSAVATLYVIDNSRNADIKSVCEQSGAKVVYIPSDNVGYGAAHNKALRKATEAGSRYHLVLNSDISFRAADIDRIAEFMETARDVVALQPKIVGTDGRLQYTVRQLPTPLDLFGRRFLPAAWIRRRDDRYLLKHLDHERPFNVPYHQGSFMFLRMSAVEKIGGFDERFFMYPEDIDITRRLHRLGRTLYWPEVTVSHHHRASSYHSPRMLMIHCVNMIRYFNKWGWWHDPERKAFNAAISQ